MSRATRNHTIVSERAIRRAAIAKIETLTQEKCRELLGLDPQAAIWNPTGARDTQLAVTQLFNEGRISARDIDRVWHGDRRSGGISHVE